MVTNSYIINTKESRFLNVEDLKELIPIFDQLNQKEKELAAAKIKAGSGSLEFQKHTIIYFLLKKLAVIIERADASRMLHYQSNQISLVLLVIRGLLDCVTSVKTKDFATLLMPRDNKRVLANNLIHYGSVGSAVTFALSSAHPIVGGLMSFFASRGVSNSVRNYVGLSNLEPASARLVQKLETTLKNIHQNLTEYNNQENSLTPTPNIVVP